jgi:zinc protease
MTNLKSSFLRYALCLAFGFVAFVIATPSLAADANAGGLVGEKYTLDNGMTVILHVDHTLPTAGINLWYRVGARNEPAGRSGFAHLFEHLMFMGTKRVPTGAFDDLMEGAGGSNNASTSLDRTNYFSSGPASILPMLLWLDADRLEALGPNMTKEKLDLQRDVVRNEIRQQVENRPYGRAYEQSFRLLYPVGHPYHNAVYGTHEDLEAANVNDVKDFFSSFYTPDNCSLVIAGDFDPEAIKPMIAKLFGTLPRNKPSQYPKIEMPKLNRIIRTTMLDKVQLPMIEFDYHSPAAYADGDGEMNLLAGILGDGRDSRLYRRLVMQDQSATSVNVTQDDAALSSVFRVQVYAKPDADLATVEAAIDQELAKIVTEGPTADEVKQRAATTELEIVRSLQEVKARADRLNEYEYYYGDPNSLQRDLDRYRKATADGVRQWAQRVLTPNARVITRVLAEEVKGAPTARDQRPTDLPSSNFKAPEPTVITLSNQIPVYVFPRHELPIVVSAVVIEPAGTLDTPAKAGLGSLLAAMTQEGAGDLDSVAFAQAASNLGARIDASAGVEALTFSLDVLSRNFEPAAQLLADAALRPRMQPKDFERVKAVALDGLQQRNDEPTVVASILSARMLIDNASRYAWPGDGTTASVTPLTLDDVKSAHQALLKDAALKIYVAGDITPEQAKASLEKAFGLWSGKATVTKSPDPVPFQKADAMRLYIVDRPDAVQTVIHLTSPAFAFSDPRRVETQLANIVLGGSFTSRLNRNLREAHGYTYGISSGVSTRRTYGTFTVATSVKADVTGPSLKEMFAELHKISTAEITDDEARKAKETYRTNLTEKFGSLDGLVTEASSLSLLGAPLDTTTKDFAQAKGADAKTLDAAAKKAIDLNHAVLMLVGDKKLILEQIKDLGLPAPVELDPEGAKRN